MSWKLNAFLEPNYNGALMDALHVKGGFRIVRNQAQMLSIPYLYRTLNTKEATIVFVREESLLYQLTNNPTSDSTSITDWTTISLGGISSFKPVGTWDPNTNTPGLLDTSALGRNGEFYFVENTPIQDDFTITGLFQGQTQTLVNGNLIVSVGDYWVAISDTTTWDAMVKPQSIIDYVNGIVIAHSHTTSDITDLATYLTDYLKRSDTADHLIAFNTVPDTSIIELEFLKTWYYTKDEIDAGYPVATFSNGLTKTADIVRWGGILTQNTTINSGLYYIDFQSSGTTGYSFQNTNIDGQGTLSVQADAVNFSMYGPDFDKYAGFGMYQSAGQPFISMFSGEELNDFSVYLGLEPWNLHIRAGGSYAGFKGIVYASDYSANYTVRSLVDKGYVDGLVGSVAAGATNQIQYKSSGGGFAANADFYFNPTKYSLVKSPFTTINNAGDLMNNVEIFGEEHTMNANPSGGGTITDAAVFGWHNEIGNQVNFYSGSSSFTAGSWNQNYAVGAFVAGQRARAKYSNSGGFVVGLNLWDDTAPYTTIEGASFNVSHNTTSQTEGHGALGAYSAIVGGQDHNIPSDSPRSAIIGGSAIKARAADADQVYVPSLNIVTTPTNDDALTQILSRDATTGLIKYRTATSLTGYLIIDPEATTAGFMPLKVNIDKKGQGQVTMTNGSNAIVGVGTNFLTATLEALGGWYEFWVKDSANNWFRVIISSISTNTNAVLAQCWNRTILRNGGLSHATTFTGVSGTYDYYLVRNWSDGQYSFVAGGQSYADNFSFALGYNAVATSGSWAFGSTVRASGANAIALGRYAQATGAQSFAGGESYTVDVNTKKLTASGQTAFLWSQNNSSQTAGHGALAANSVILGGLNHNVASGASRSSILGGNLNKITSSSLDAAIIGGSSNQFSSGVSSRSVIIGGNSINVNTAVLDTVFMPKVRVGLGTGGGLTTNNSNTNLVVRNSSTGELEIRDASTTLWGTSGNTTLTGDIDISGDYYITFGDSGISGFIAYSDATTHLAMVGVDAVGTYLGARGSILEYYDGVTPKRGQVIIDNEGLTLGTGRRTIGAGFNVWVNTPSAAILIPADAADPFLIIDNASRGGIRYDADYSASFTLRSLVDKDYVDTAVSDIRLKENIVRIPTALELVNRLNPVEFDMIADHEHKAGFIAQELEEILPNLVVTSESGIKKIKRDQLMPYIVKALQELAVEVSNLKTKV